MSKLSTKFTSTLTLLAVGAVLSAGLTGCKKDKVKTAPVSGTVTYNDKPVANANLMFHYEAGKGGGDTSATTDSEGKFSKDLPIGNAKVTITKSEGSDKNKEMTADQYAEMMQSGGESQQVPGSEAKDLLPKKYALPASSGLAAKIEEGKENSFDFKLKD